MAAVLGIATLVVIVLLWRRAAGTPESVSGEDELLQLCHGDKAQMERLIASQIQNAPGVRRSVAITRAAYSIRRDKR